MFRLTCIDSFFRALVGRLPLLNCNRLPADSKVFRRSNYTRIEHGNYAWGFIPKCIPEDLVIRTHPRTGLSGGMGRVFTKELEGVYDAQELRSIGYTFLAAANSLDGRDSKSRRKAPRSRADAEVIA